MALYSYGPNQLHTARIGSRSVSSSRACGSSARSRRGAAGWKKFLGVLSCDTSQPRLVFFLLFFGRK